MPRLFLKAPLIIFVAVLIMNDPLISICIPAYKKPHYVVRCLESILKQDYKNVEVIISDDSPDEEILSAISMFKAKLPIKYVSNSPALKSPKNWNAALDLAKGDFYLLLHQDDWFHSKYALSKFVNAFKDTTVDFVFCRNTAVDEEGKQKILQSMPALLSKLLQRPNRLVLSQVIGPPSNAMFRKKVIIRYDENFIWLVDVDYYSRLLKAGHNYEYLDEHLVSIGIHADQTTEFCRANPDIIFRENIQFAVKIGAPAFNDILIYDYYWRLLRNHQIRAAHDFERNGVALQSVPQVIWQMFSVQKKIAHRLLQLGAGSKLFMAISYLGWQLNNKQ